MKNNKIYVDAHILQTVPPSCVNRDDTGSPKTSIYGGVTRARVSSQSWKKSIRDMLRDEYDYNGNFGVRTKFLVEMVAEKIKEIEPSVLDEKAEQFAQDTINLASKDPKKPIIPKDDDKKETDPDKSSALFFITPNQAYLVAKLAAEWIVNNKKPKKKDVADALMKNHGVDISLFGRLVTQAPDINIDACVQVAHGISTHKVSNEYDYFTAVDDLLPDDSAGAAHIGTTEFNSSTLYRYATIAVHELHKQLGSDTPDIVNQFIRAFIYSMPTGKQNSYANRTLPNAILITLRKDQPINFVGAFEKPVIANGAGYIANSAKQLIEHITDTYDSFAKAPVLSLAIGKLLSDLGPTNSTDKSLQLLQEELHNLLNEI